MDLKKLNVNRLAQLSDISPNSIGRYLKQTSYPRIDDVVKLADALDIPAEYLFRNTSSNDWLTPKDLVERLYKWSEDNL